MKRTYPDLPVVIISGHGNIETAVTAIKRGAYDYIEKPFKADRLVLVALRALEASQLKREVKELKERSVVSAEMIGKSLGDQSAQRKHRQGGADQQPHHAARRIGSRQGTRRARPAPEIAARRWSLRRPQRGGDGARSCRRRTLRHRGPHGGPRKVGALEDAHSGTLYIDEVADMPMETQGKILRVLVEQKFLRLGGSQKVSGRCPHHFFDVSRPRSGHPRRPFPRRSLSSSERRYAARSGLAERREDIPDSFSFSSDSGANHRALPHGASARMPSPFCRRTIGRATCASFATTSSAC